MEFTKGKRVEHINHGKAIVIEESQFDDSAVLVEFDEYVKGWGKELYVSKNCLKFL